MKKYIYFMMTILLLCLFINKVDADCTDAELSQIKKDVSKVTISYKHLGEVVKEDGSIVYNEFMVTAKNIPEDVYVYLSPMTLEKFETDDEELKIRLTTGNWEYNFYSAKCSAVVNKISFKLPTFNIYSLDPLCSGIDADEFKLCGKYYEGTVSRESFEQRLELYKKLHASEDKKEESEDKIDIIAIIKDFIVKYYIYMVMAIVFTLFVALIVIIISKRKSKKLLQ